MTNRKAARGRRLRRLIRGRRFNPAKPSKKRAHTRFFGPEKSSALAALAGGRKGGEDGDSVPVPLLRPCAGDVVNQDKRAMLAELADKAASVFMKLGHDQLCQRIAAD
jgi:hypothetical protein